MTAAAVADFVQWSAILVLAGLVLLLFRQVGLLHERMGPVGALTLPGGVAAGDTAPVLHLTDIDGTAWQIGGPECERRSTLIFFLSPTCPICKSLIPVLKSLALEFGGATRFILASDGDEQAQRRMIGEERLQRFPLILSAELGMTYGVAKLPYAVLLNGEGVVAAKGLVNNREHLESLFEAQARGVATLQNFLQRTDREQRSGAA